MIQGTHLCLWHCNDPTKYAQSHMILHHVKCTFHIPRNTTCYEKSRDKTFDTIMQTWKLYGLSSYVACWRVQCNEDRCGGLNK